MRIFRLSLGLAAVLPFALVGAGQVAAMPRFIPGPSPSPNYSESARWGDIVVLSGQLGARDGAMPAEFTAEARQAMDNVAAALGRQGLALKDVMKCTVLMTDMRDWDAFNGVYKAYFEAGRMPARTAFGVNALPLGARVEVECWAAIGRPTPQE